LWVNWFIGLGGVGEGPVALFHMNNYTSVPPHHKQLIPEQNSVEYNVPISLQPRARRSSLTMTRTHVSKHVGAAEQNNKLLNKSVILLVIYELID
jgi:hypothetical protein